MVAKILFGILSLAVVRLHQSHERPTFRFSPQISGAISKMVHVHELANWKWPALLQLRCNLQDDLAFQEYVPLRVCLRDSQLTQLLGGILHDYPMSRLSRLSDTLLQNCVAVGSKTSSRSLRQGERACLSGGSSCYLVVM